MTLGGAALAQNAQPNWDYRFRGEARADDNFNLSDDNVGSGSFLINTLGISNRTSTRVSNFALDLSGHVRVQDIPTQSETVRFDDPTIRLNYDRQSRDDILRFRFFANQVDIAFYDTLRGSGRLNELDFDDTRGEGERQTLTAGLSGVVNEDAPFTFTYNLSTFQIRYDNNTDPDLNDRSENFASTSFLFDITRTTRAVIDLGYDYRDVDDEQQTLRRRGRVSAGVNAALDQRTTLRFRLGYSEVKTKRQTFDTEDTETGTIGSFGLVRDLRDGEASLNYVLDLDENGQRDRLTVGRVFQRGTTSYGGTLGITTSEGVDKTRPVGTLFISQELPRAKVGARLTQGVGVDDNSRETVFTRLGVTYEQDFTSDLSFVLDISAGRKFEEQAQNRETRRLNATASVRKALTEQWDLDVGYRHRYRESDDSTTASSNAVFAAIVRDLQID